jgi:hypothetical protein
MGLGIWGERSRDMGKVQGYGGERSRDMGKVQGYGVKGGMAISNWYNSIFLLHMLRKVQGYGEEYRDMGKSTGIWGRVQGYGEKGTGIWGRLAQHKGEVFFLDILHF